METKDIDLEREAPSEKPEAMDLIFRAGQSRRIWNELYKVSQSGLTTCFVTFLSVTACLDCDYLITCESFVYLITVNIYKYKCIYNVLVFQLFIEIK